MGALFESKYLWIFTTCNYQWWNGKHWLPAKKPLTKNSYKKNIYRHSMLIKFKKHMIQKCSTIIVSLYTRRCGTVDEIPEMTRRPNTSCCVCARQESDSNYSLTYMLNWNIVIEHFLWILLCSAAEATLIVGRVLLRVALI
jgi:hypothetical protein